MVDSLDFEAIQAAGIADARARAGLLEYLVDLGSLVERYPDKILIGNLNSSTLARGPREAITREVRACMEVGARARRFVVNVGGGLTHDIPVEHLEHYLSLRKELARSLRAR